MINQSELRIGNLIYYKRTPIITEIKIVLAVFDNNIILINEGNQDGASWPKSTPQFEPIELSYDLLTESCGFIDYAKNGMGCRIEVNSVDELCFYCDNGELRYQTKGSGFTRDFGVKYLHQLQNLYYMLTGKELTIKI